MRKNVEVSIDIEIARRMLGVAGFHNEARTMTDDEIFEQVLKLIECYGAQSKVISNLDEMKSSNEKKPTTTCNEKDWPKPCENYCLDGYCTFDKSEEDIENGWLPLCDNITHSRRCTIW